jgi:hypothetical protein
MRVSVLGAKYSRTLTSTPKIAYKIRLDLCSHFSNQIINYNLHAKRNYKFNSPRNAKP